jgi:hypothetical protein
MLYIIIQYITCLLCHIVCVIIFVVFTQWNKTRISITHFYDDLSAAGFST